jgi:hypothetical protein
MSDYLKYQENIKECKNISSVYIKKLNVDSRKKYEQENFDLIKFNKFDEILKQIAALFKVDFISEKEELLKKVKSLNNDEFITKKIKIDMAKTFKSIKTDLPESANLILENIKINFNKLNEKDIKNSLINIESLYEQKIPDILRKYLSIDMEYRQSLKNIEGKNAEELMLESLVHIQEIVKKEILGLNENNLRELSITQRHVKAIKNSI